ncbi:uncharacterized protein LOC130963153 [Arachis stenosperma]|uniref:uncharacterized protein LOC130963153 n=1 Tax=Arachis stenosperma TaxID=217475 RepID=UPI0025AD238C|nr:uncharacterized protein LOC130963153 [Arachis stenosperma]
MEKGYGNNLGGTLMTLFSVLKVHPPTFRGSTNSTESYNWFQAMERALQAQHVLNNQFVEFAAYQLLGEAQHWWQEKCRLLQLQNADIPWDVFQTAFYKKYFSKSVREARELELMQLKQGSLSMADFTSRFEELYRFSKICQGNGNLNEGLHQGLENQDGKNLKHTDNLHGLQPLMQEQRDLYSLLQMQEEEQRELETIVATMNKTVKYIVSHLRSCNQDTPVDECKKFTEERSKEKSLEDDLEPQEKEEEKRHKLPKVKDIKIL